MQKEAVDQKRDLPRQDRKSDQVTPQSVNETEARTAAKAITK